MDDPATLDQLRMLVAVADTGSFTAAARRLHRVQSAVSHGVAAVEERLGVRLFERTTRSARPTAAGEVFLAEARRLCARADELRQVGAGLTGETEPVVSAVVDVLFPSDALATACVAFAARHPTVRLRLHTEALADVAALVRDGTCAFGVAGEASGEAGLTAAPLGVVHMVPVVAPGHALAGEAGPIDALRLAEEVQIVLSERGGARGAGPTPDQSVFSARTWRIHDLHTKRQLLLAGLGWGNLPEHLCRDDLAAGRLVRLRPTAWAEDTLALRMSVLTRTDTWLGPASRWLIGTLAEACAAGTVATPARPG
ncbi:MAG: LysR family transcriptional regulator [Myxococcota bacterium]